MKKDLKTTISGIVGALGVILPLLGIPSEVGQAVSVIGIFCLGFFSKDR